jgi:hypothetical protein
MHGTLSIVILADENLRMSVYRDPQEYSHCSPQELAYIRNSGEWK